LQDIALTEAIAIKMGVIQPRSTVDHVAINDAIDAKYNDPVSIAKGKWNSQADEYNQWDMLGEDEKRELINREQPESDDFDY
jgi:hypothetical protein